MKRILTILLSSFFSAVLWAGEFKPAGIFGDNAVLQQGVPVPVWGKSPPYAGVRVSLAGKCLSTTADGQGKWMMHFPPLKADGIAHTLTFVCGEEKITYENILIGEVWFASGQSNMAHTMNDGVTGGAQEIAVADYPQIRFRTVDAAAESMPADDIPQKEWLVCTPENAGTFSAVSYYFAREFHLDKNVPVGVIVSAVGATGIGCWMSRESLLAYPPTRAETEAFDPDPVLWDARVKRVDSLNRASGEILTSSTVGIDLGVHRTEFDDKAWNRTEYPMDIPKMGYPGFWGLIWTRKPFELTPEAAGKEWTLHLPLIVSDYRAYLNGTEIKRGYTSLTDLEETVIGIPAGKLQAGKNVLSFRLWVIWSLAILGDKEMPCYLQAEDGTRIDLTGIWAHNSEIEPEVYRLQDNYWFQSTANYNGMVAPVIPYAIAGFLWYQGEANHQWGEAYAEMQPLLTDDWRVRWKLGHIPFLYVQLAAFGDHSEIPVTEDYMAEFRDYQTTITERSTRSFMACAIDAGEEKNIHPRNKAVIGQRLYATYKANVLKESETGDSPRFRSAVREGNRIRITFTHAPNGLITQDGQPPLGFALCGADGEWFWADAVIDGRDILLSCGGIENPARIQYAWQGYPKVNLYSAEGFPVLPFKEEIKPY